MLYTMNPDGTRNVKHVPHGKKVPAHFREAHEYLHHKCGDMFKLSTRATLRAPMPLVGTGSFRMCSVTRTNLHYITS